MCSTRQKDGGGVIKGGGVTLRRAGVTAAFREDQTRRNITAGESVQTGPNPAHLSKRLTVTHSQAAAGTSFSAGGAPTNAGADLSHLGGAFFLVRRGQKLLESGPSDAVAMLALC